MQEINVIDLTKAETDEESTKEQKLWSQLFKAKTREELEMIANESEEWAEAANKVLLLSADERAQAYAFSQDNAAFARRLHELGIREEAIEQGIERGLEQGIEQGLEQGIEQGLEQGIEKVAKNMLAMGLSLEDVVKASGLCIEVVKKMQ